MMSDMDFPLQEWRDSYEQAEIAEWNTHSPDLHDWPLAQFMCGMVKNNDTIRRDPESMQAAMNVLASEDYDGFSPEFFNKVMQSANGKTGESFEELCREHAEENYHPGEEGDPREEFESFTTADDFESWYTNNVIRDGEVCAEDDAGGTLFWFNKNKW
jgi:hypothetical protein